MNTIEQWCRLEIYINETHTRLFPYKFDSQNCEKAIVGTRYTVRNL